MKKLILTLALLLLTVAPASAQAIKKAHFTKTYDLDSAALIYCVTTGNNGDAFGGPIQGPKPIKTTGSSTTVVAVNAGDAPFISLAVGDNLLVTRPDNSVDLRIITVKTDNDTVTVNAAVNWDQTGGFAFRFEKLTCGTAVTDGWIPVGDLENVKIVMQYDQGDLTSLDIRGECRDSSANTQPVIVYPGDASDCGPGTLSSALCNFTAVARLYFQPNSGINSSGAVPPWEACRIGLKANTDTSDAGANVESITAYLVGVVRN